MAAHGIGPYDFESWQGDAPSFEHAIIETHHRPGTFGQHQSYTGDKGAPFEATLRHPFASYAAAQAGLKLWIDNLVGVGPLPIKYNNVNYLGIYGHLYSVDDVLGQNAYAAIGLIGPTYNYPSGGVAVIRLQLLPHKVI